MSANPRSAPAELAGLAQQTRPRALITDAGLTALVAQAGLAGGLPLGVLDAGELAGDWARGRPGAPEGAGPEGAGPGGAGPGGAAPGSELPGPAPARERQEEMERRLGLPIVVGYAMSESPTG